MYNTITRRQVLKSTIGVIGLSSLSAFGGFSLLKSKAIKIGACDWSIGKHSDVDAIKIAKKIGLDGVQVSLGKATNNMHLRQTEIQQLYKQASIEHNIAIAGMAIGELNHFPYKSEPISEQWVSDSIDVAKIMGNKVVLLAFFNKGDLKGDKEGTKEVIRRLKKVAPKAEANGITLGIESWLSAEEHMQIIEAVGSPNVKVYYDVANSNRMGYNIYEEIRWLGKENICEFHAKENGNLLGQGKIDFTEVSKAISDIDYEGWVMIEGAIPPNANMLENYVLNNKFIRSCLIKS